jgi:O-antigen/teichoic acid export membrane protein
LKDIVSNLKKDQRYFRVIKSGLFSIAIRFLSILISFISIPLTLNYLGNERYGIWLTITSIISVLNFADLGLGVSLVNSISKAYANDSIIDAKKHISNIFFLLLFISIISIICYLFIYDYIFIFNDNSFSSINIRNETKFTLFSFIVITLFSLPFGIVQRIYEGYQIGYIFQKFLFIGSIIGFLFLFLFIKLELSLPYLTFAFLLPNLLASIIGGVNLILFHSKDLLPSFSLFHFEGAFFYLKTGLIFFLLQFFSFINLSTDNFIISNYSSLNNVTQFDLTKKLFSITLLFSFFITPLWPAFAEALEKKDFLWVKKKLYYSIIMILVLTFLCSLFFLIFYRYVFEFWIGSQFDLPLHFLISFFLFSLIANFGGIMSTFFSSNVFLKKQLIFIFLSTLSTLLLKIIFIKYFGLYYLIWANNISFVIFFVTPSLILVKLFFKKNII